MRESRALTRALSLVPVAQHEALTNESWADPDNFDAWRSDLRRAVLRRVAEFVAERCVKDLAGAGVEIAGDVC